MIIHQPVGCDLSVLCGRCFRGHEDRFPLASQVGVTVFAAALYRLVMRTKTAARQGAVKLLLRLLPLVLFV